MLDMFNDFDLMTFNTHKVKTKINELEHLFNLVKTENKNIALSFSGGKDSTACLLLCLHFGLKPEIVWFNSGYEFPETEDYIKNLVKKYDLKLREIKPTLDPLQHKINAGYFDLKAIEKANKEILNVWHSTNKEYDCVITGLRMQESKARRMNIGKNGQYFYNKTFVSNAFYPVAKFNAKEIFAIIVGLGEKYHPIYEKATSLNERDWLRVNWYILTAGEKGFYVFLKKHYTEQYNFLVRQLPEIRSYT